jgi:CRP-like cAMP-binding protein
MEDGSSIEVATIGQEGLAGWPAVLAQPADRMPVPSLPYRYNMQVAGRARRMSVAALARLLVHDGAFRTLLFRYHAAFLTQVMQGVACNGLHSVEQRCCRWLLSTQDRIGTPELAITHDFLSQMLGVRRASVSDVLGPLQDQGLIRAARGKVTILDSAALAASACECYRVIRGEYQRLLG